MNNLFCFKNPRATLKRTRNGHISITLKRICLIETFYSALTGLRKTKEKFLFQFLNENSKIEELDKS